MNKGIHNDDDIKMLLARIDAELSHIEKEKKKLPDIVALEIDSFWANLPQKEKLNINKEEFINKYKDGLRQKFLKSLETTANKLHTLKRQLAPSL